MNKIIIKGRIPSKKNSRINTRSGRSFPSKKYKEWHDDATLQIREQKPDKIPDGSHMQLNFYMPDNRRCDLTNKAESIMDLFVDNELLTDDCWQIIPVIDLIGHGVDKEDPRCEIVWVG